MNWHKATASGGGNCAELAWRKSSFSTVRECVEVAHCAMVHIRDSKHPEAGHLTVTREAFARFLADLRASCR